MKYKIFTTLLSTIIMVTLLSGYNNISAEENINTVSLSTGTEDAETEDTTDLKEDNLIVLLTNSTTYNADGSIDGWGKYEYDNNGNITKETYY